MDNFISGLNCANKIKFYYINLIDAVIQTVQDPTLEGKLYHTSESSLDLRTCV